MQKGTFRLPTVRSLVRYRARTKKDIGIVLCFEPDGMVKGATCVLWLDHGVREWLKWTSALEIIA
jgi:hypothetical protein